MPFVKGNLTVTAAILRIVRRREALLLIVKPEVDTTDGYEYVGIDLTGTRKTYHTTATALLSTYCQHYSGSRAVFARTATVAISRSLLRPAELTP